MVLLGAVIDELLLPEIAVAIVVNDEQGEGPLGEEHQHGLVGLQVAEATLQLHAHVAACHLALDEDLLVVELVDTHRIEHGRPQFHAAELRHVEIAPFDALVYRYILQVLGHGAGNTYEVLALADARTKAVEHVVLKPDRMGELVGLCSGMERLQEELPQELLLLEALQHGTEIIQYALASRATDAVQHELFHHGLLAVDHALCAEACWPARCGESTGEGAYSVALMPVR
jgi:hypothetical protein